MTETNAQIKNDVPIDRKLLLTLEEAAAYSGLGINRFRDLSNNDPDFETVIYHAGNRRMFKRRQLEEYFDYSNGGVV